MLLPSLIPFAISFGLILSHYFLFPAFLALVAYFSKRPSLKTSDCPTVSVIVAAYNESKVIVDKIENSLFLDYPLAKLELIIVTDGSTDDSFAKAVRFSSSRVSVLHEAQRRGKSAALNRGVDLATGDILLFTDANTMLEKDALRKLVRHYSDPKVAGVSGRKQVYSNRGREAAKGDRGFWALESRLKSWQSQVGSISTGDGEIFSIRRALFKPLSPKVINDDMEITLSLIERGFRVLYEPEAIAFEEASKTLHEDFRVKARMVYGGYQAIRRHERLLANPLRFFSIQFALHKTLRYLMPLLLLVVFFSSVWLSLITSGVPNLLLSLFILAQTTFYFCSVIGWVIQSLGIRRNPLYFPLYFSYMNYGALVGLYYFLRGSSLASVWTKAER